MFAEPRPSARLVSREQRIAPFDPIHVFASAQDLPTRALWLRPDTNEALVGLGAAWTVTAHGPERFQRVGAAWRDLLAGSDPDGGPPRLLGGFSFDAMAPSTALWTGFPPALMVLPERLFSLRGDQARLTISAVSDPKASAAPNDESFATAALDADGWQALVERVAKGIREERLGVTKLVLARACQVRPTRSIEAALRTLAAEYPTCTVFAFAHAGACFLGATPERLIALRNGTATTMALAGSVPRGATADEDARLASQLTSSPKERNEHSVVVSALREALAGVSTRLMVDAEPRVRRLANVQHLITSVRAQVAAGTNVLELVERLNPTPAVGGFPRERALQLIRQYEQLDRGWYAAPIGWIDSNGEGEFAVGLRSALVRKERATLFAGCGIVADSDPQREFAEWGWKLRPMLAALGAQT